MAWTLALGGGVSLAAAAVFAYVARRSSARARPTEDRLAARAFTAWWLGVAAYAALVAAADVAAFLGVRDPRAFVAWRLATFPVLAVALWGLMGYFAYLFTGRRRWFAVAAALYAALALAAAAHVLLVPHHVVVGAWRVDVLPAHEGPAAWRALAALFLLPQAIGAVAYLTLARRADPERRRRILLVGSAILLWTASALAARLASADLWQFVARDVLGLLVVWAVLAAYRAPPAPRPDGLEGLRKRVAELV